MPVGTTQLMDNIGLRKMAKSKNAFDYVLAADAETSGIAFGSVDPTFNPKTSEEFTAVSFGLIVADVNTFKPIDELYVEIQFNEDRYVWSEGAERVHGLSRDYLRDNGLTRSEAAHKIREFLEKYYGPLDEIRKLPLLGHNVATFDRYFLIELLREIGPEPKFGNRHIDTFGLGVTLLNCFSSDELFELLGLERDPNNHNALQDARHALKAVRLIKKYFMQKGE